MADDPDDNLMDLSIEALTGTVYDLCVSPYETILGIKLKIQRLEGIPVYQQQLVYGGTELQDELCLEECSIPPGAQLKLLIAMRGGPIHAQRVHLDLEDSTLLELAELLDSQERYTVMLLRNGDDVHSASFLQVQMENCESVSCSPVQVSESHQRMSVTANKAAQSENAVTRDKMKELMAKLKKIRAFKHCQPSLSSKQANVLFLESRTPSRLLRSPSSHPSPLPHGDLRASAQRKLYFSSSSTDSEHPAHSRVKKNSRRELSKRARSPETETPELTRKPMAQVGGASVAGPLPPARDWRKGAKRVRRNSHVDTAHRAVPGLNTNDPVSELAAQVSQLGLDPAPLHQARRRGSGSEHPPTAATPRFLPDIPSSSSSSSYQTTPSSFTSVVAAANKHPSSSSTRSSTRLPPLVVSKTTSPTHHLPPLSSNVVLPRQSKKRKRCLQCGKKMGLATTYTCRCGGVFCALHRYAETHGCSFDYKSEGRDVLTRNNPVVTAPKLSKF